MTERQIRIVGFINQNGKITNRDMRNLFNVSSQAAHKKIKKLLKLGVVKSIGRSRGIYYKLT